MPGIQVTLDEDVFKALQARAVPLVDDINGVLRRMLVTETPEPVESVPATSHLARGASLPVGLELRASFQQKTFEARVTEAGIEFDGRTYHSASAAARAVKTCAGASERASHSNGWTFWRYLDRRTMRLEPLERLRSGGRPMLPSPSSALIGAYESDHDDTSTLAAEPLWNGR